MKEECKNCRYRFDGVYEDENGVTMDECRRFPPGLDGWPTIGNGDWCGEWAFNKKLELESEGGST